MIVACISSSNKLVVVVVVVIVIASKSIGSLCFTMQWKLLRVITLRQCETDKIKPLTTIRNYIIHVT
jgi:hypothetical protein